MEDIILWKDWRMLEHLWSQSILERATTNILIILLKESPNTTDEQEPSCMLFVNDRSGRLLILLFPWSAVTERQWTCNEPLEDLACEWRLNKTRLCRWQRIQENSCRAPYLRLREKTEGNAGIHGQDWRRRRRRRWFFTQATNSGCDETTTGCKTALWKVSKAPAGAGWGWLWCTAQQAWAINLGHVRTHCGASWITGLGSRWLCVITGGARRG